MKSTGRIFLGIVFLFSAFSVNADRCEDEFHEGLQSHTNNKIISFSDCGSLINNNPSAQLSSSTVSNPGACGVLTCGMLGNCAPSGTPVTKISAGSFQTSSQAGGNITINSETTLGGSGNAVTDYGTVTLTDGTLNFSANPSGNTVYRIKNLNIAANATINLQPGNYWVETLTIGANHTIKVAGSNTARLFISNPVNTTYQCKWNTSGTADRLFVYGYGKINIVKTSGSASVIRAIMHSDDDITLGKVTHRGAATGRNVTLNNGSTVDYDGNAVSNTDFGDICPKVRKFGVSAPATSNKCQNTTVTVTAQKSNGTTVTGYTNTIKLDTQSGSGTWVSTSGSGIFTGGTTNGKATYKFAAADNGVASFQLSYPGTGSSPIIIKAYQSSNSGISGLSGAVNFASIGLLITDTAVSNPPPSLPPAFSTTKIAGADFTLYLTNINSSTCNINTSYTGAKNIRFYTTYVNPISGTMNATINGTTIASSAGAVATTQPITFTNGVATVTARYNDAGKLSMKVIDTAVSPAGPTGVTGNFVVKPASFAVNIPNNTASQTQTAAACLGDTVFAKAGNNFTVNIQPRNALGNVTPNYGNETTPQGIILNSGAIYGPTNARNGSANNGVIGNGSAFIKKTSGAVPAGSGWSLPYFQGTTFSFDEVGCINLTVGVSGGNYLGATNGAVSGPSVQVVGRFIPDHFDVSGNTPQFKTATSGIAGSFTYLDQPFLYTTGSKPVLTVIARALAGTTTKNYTGSFWKLASTGFGSLYNKAYYPVNAGDAIPALNLAATIPTPTFVDIGGGNAITPGTGTGTFTFSDNGGLKLQRLNGILSPALIAEIQLKIPTITDADSVACTGTGCVTGGFAFGATTAGNGIAFSGTGGGKKFYHGRLVVLDASGAENLALTVPMQTQYYTSTGGFVLNGLDTASVGNGTAFTGGAASLILTPSSGLVTSATVVGSPTYYFSGGLLNITLAAPTGTTTGYVDIEANLVPSAANLPWLQYNWPYLGTPVTNFSLNPRGRGNFGIAKGNNRIIYQKEVTH